MLGVSTIDIEVPGDGKRCAARFSIDGERGSAHPLSAEHRDMIPEPFAAMAPLHAATQDTRALRHGHRLVGGRDHPNPMRARVARAAFQFGLESQPLLALVTFEVASPNIASPPEIFVNGENLGPVFVTFPDLAGSGLSRTDRVAPARDAFSIHRLVARAETGSRQPI